jgi:signal transduction histidine kinase/HAMP domain-containing protein
MKKIKDISIKSKLIFIQAGVTFLMAFIFVALLWFNDNRLFKESAVEKMYSLARITGDNMVSSLLFLDKEFANTILQNLNSELDIKGAVVFDRSDKFFERYDRDGISIQDIENVYSGQLSKDQILTHEFIGNQLIVSYKIFHSKEFLGTIILTTELLDLQKIISNYLRIVGLILLLSFISNVFVSFLLQRMVSNRLLYLVNTMKDVSESGNYAIGVPVDSKDEIGVLAGGFNTMLNRIEKMESDLKASNIMLEEKVKKRTSELSSANENLLVEIHERKTASDELQKASQKHIQQNWKLAGISELNDVMRGESSIHNLIQEVINKLCSYLGISIGAIYLTENHTGFKFYAGYAISKIQHNSNKTINFGEGLVGQAAFEKKTIVLSDVPDDYIKINSGLGEAVPKELLVMPFTYENKVKGVLELANINRFTDLQLDFLKQVLINIAPVIHASQAREQISNLLQKTQLQSIDLLSKQKELKQINDELTSQRNRLQASEEKLKAKHEELSQKNIVLQEKTILLENQNETIVLKNKDLENIKEELTQKAEALAVTGKYKAAFLSNMSHELKTPLNSILILAKLLSENKDRNLHSEQMESVKGIYRSGNDLLSLINDILNLSKIEAGKLSFNFANVSLNGIKEELKSLFDDLAQQKNITFNQSMVSGLPEHIYTDKERLMEVLKNLLSNAFKFTDRNGLVELKIFSAPEGIQYKSANLKTGKNIIAFEVKDTGIGISNEKQSIIFEAFQQAEAPISRKYGGTGLGLTISRDIMSILGGEIQLKSMEGIGSTFTVFLPSQIILKAASVVEDSQKKETKVIA